MKSAERREPHRHLHTKLSVCTTRKLMSCRQTRKNCLLNFLHRASGSLKMRLPRKNGERKRNARKREARYQAYPLDRRSGEGLNAHFRTAPNSKCSQQFVKPFSHFCSNFCKHPYFSTIFINFAPILMIFFRNFAEHSRKC